jgi:ATP-dependent transcriptional regulator
MGNVGSSIKIVKAQEMIRRTMLLKGPSGAGKTYQFRTLVARGMNGLYADVEAKLASVRDLDPDLFLLRALDVPLTVDEKQRMLRSGESDFMALCDFLRSRDHSYDFVYFDSLMRYADKLVNFLRHGKGLSGYDLWGAFGEKMRVVLETLVSLASPEHPKPVHVIATWGVEVGQDWQGKRAIQPIIDGKMVGPRIDYYFDDVLMLWKKEDAATGKLQYLAYTGGTQEFSAKVSAGPGVLPAIIEAPDLGRILEVLQAPMAVNNNKE